MTNYGYYLNELNGTQMNCFFLRHLCPVPKLFCCGHVPGCQTHMPALHTPVCVHAITAWVTISCSHKHSEICQIRVNGDVSSLSLPIILIKVYANLAVV